LLLPLIIFLIVIALRFILTLLTLHLRFRCLWQVFRDLDYILALLINLMFGLFISRALQVWMMQLKYLTFITALLIIIGGLIYIPCWLLLSDRCLRGLLTPIHGSCMSDVIFSRLRLNNLEIYLIVPDWSTLSW